MKIYKKGNYIVFDSVNGVMKLEHANHVMLSKSTLDSNEFTFASDDLGIVKVSFSDITDENDDAYSDLNTFNTFIFGATGFNTASGGSGAVTIGNVVYVSSLTDFPTPVSDVITLVADTTYILTTEIDLLGSRLVAGGVCNLFGLSSEVSFLTSTGLDSSTPLITSIYTIVIERISFKDVGTCFSIDGNTNLVALDWKAVNFINIPNVGVVNKCDNFIFDTGSFLGSQGLRFTGSIGTIGLNNSLFRGIGTAGNIIELDASCIITRRFRIIYSSIVAFSSTVGINVNASATIPTESYILDTINFSGGGTYTSGLNHTSNKTLFTNCVGIQNTASRGFMFMVNNTTDTSIGIPNVNDWVKASGTTTAGGLNAQFTHSSNRLTYTGALSQSFHIVVCANVRTSNTNQVISIGIAVNGAIITDSEMTIRTSNSNQEYPGATQYSINLTNNDYVELFVKNTNSTDVRVSDFNINISKIAS